MDRKRKKSEHEARRAEYALALVEARAHAEAGRVPQAVEIMWALGEVETTGYDMGYEQRMRWHETVGAMERALGREPSVFTRTALIDLAEAFLATRPTMADIAALQAEALNAGDAAQAQLCLDALEGDVWARGKCERVILAARRASE